MLREASELLGQPIDARDGRLGTVEDLYFDDQTWHVRYALVRTGLPFRREHLLVEPGALTRPAWPRGDGPAHLGVWLSRREARGRPDASGQASIASQFVHPVHPASASVHAHGDLLEDVRAVVAAGTHLRSMREARTYRLAARDGHAGAIGNFVLDDATWTVCHIEAEVELFIGKKPVLVPPHAVEVVDADGRTVRVGLSRHALGGAPRFQRAALTSRLYQMCVFDYYATATGAPLMKASRTPRAGTIDARMLLSTMD